MIDDEWMHTKFAAAYVRVTWLNTVTVDVRHMYMNDLNFRWQVVEASQIIVFLVRL